jgi:hypothetical protein
MIREEQIKAAWESAFKNVVESIDTERTKEEIASIFFELGCRWSDENRPVDWQQARIQAAIAAMQGMLSNPSSVSVKDEVIIQESAMFADALVEELKGE